jgi:iron only hydrogenase large subunit-like protein
MACYGGCIGGGGQPAFANKEILQKRVSALISEDQGKLIRKSHKNPTALKIYKEFVGDIGGKKAHELLHTKYYRRAYK